MNKTLPDDFVSNASLTRPSRTLAGWLMTIALVWLLLPSSSYHFQSIALEPEHLAQATHGLEVGIGSASWLSLYRQGTGPMAQGRRGIDWEPWQLEWHLQWMIAAPVGLLLLTSLLLTRSWRERLDPVLRSIATSAQDLGQATVNGLLAGMIAMIVFSSGLPGPHETVLERADAEALKSRLSAQLVDSQPRYRLRLERQADEQPALVIRRYLWNHFHPDPFGPLVQATELERGDLQYFRSPFNPAALALSLGLTLIAFGITLRRQRRERGPSLNPASS